MSACLYCAPKPSSLVRGADKRHALCPAPPSPRLAPHSIKAFNDMAKSVKKAKGMELTWNGGVMDGKFVKPADIAKLESLPTKKQLIGQIAGAIKQVTTKVARGTNGVALKMAYGVKAIADGKSEIVKA
jgi:large subunit ribosomal protein L10